MQCPSCGFQNIPGQERCGVCSTPLSTSEKRESVLPPRAKDRSAVQRVAWNVTSQPFWISLSNRLHGIRASSGDRLRRFTFGRPSYGFGLREVGRTLLAVIPGVGHMYTENKRALGRVILLASLAALGVAVLAYRTPLADILVYGVLGLSVSSVYIAIYTMRGQRGSASGQQMQRLGIILLVIAVYFSLYTIARLAINPYVTIARIATAPVTVPIDAGDSLLVRRNVPLERGDVIIGTLRIGYVYGANIGPIIGLPGDKITFSDRIYVNGVPVAVDLPHRRPQDMEPTLPAMAETILGADEYWIMPMFEGNPPDLGTIGTTGVVQRNDILGRVVAVIGPPSHRRWMGKLQIIRE